MKELTDPRSSPTPDFIASMRAKFPVERELDRVLTQKMVARSGPGYSPISLEVLAEATRRLIASKDDRDFQLSNPRWLQGGASKLQIAFDLTWNRQDAHGGRQTPMVLRMEPPESIVPTSRRREMQVLQLMEGVVPVPRCHWIDADATFLPYPAIVYEFMEGSAKPAKRVTQQVSGIGTNFGPNLRQALAPQFIACMAKIHTVSASGIATLGEFDVVSGGSNASVIRQVNYWRRIWEEDRPYELPLVDIATQWLVDNAPPIDHVSVVHGDLRAGNFLFSETTQKITALLDWELAVVGDRHQDLAWATGTHFGHYAEDGKTFLACGLLPTDRLYEDYEKASGLSVDRSRLHYYRLFNDYAGVITMLGTAWRVANHGKTHQDIVVAWISMIGNVIAASLRDSLARVI